MPLRDELVTFTPYNAQEEADRAVMVRFLDEWPSEVLFSRASSVHFTVSAWIVNPTRDRVLMAFHNIYRSWSWTGGHASSSDGLNMFALQKAMQETGLMAMKLTSNDIYSLEVIASNGHYVDTSYVSSHLHLNLTYLLEADEKETPHADIKENCGVKWFGLRRAAAQPNGEWSRSIYEKLNAKFEFV